jgi:hypothetical protein
MASETSGMIPEHMADFARNHGDLAATAVAQIAEVLAADSTNATKLGQSAHILATVQASQAVMIDMMIEAASAPR